MKEAQKRKFIKVVSNRFNVLMEFTKSNYKSNHITIFPTNDNYDKGRYLQGCFHLLEYGCSCSFLRDTLVWKRLASLLVGELVSCYLDDGLYPNLKIHKMILERSQHYLILCKHNNQQNCLMWTCERSFD